MNSTNTSVNVIVTSPASAAAFLLELEKSGGLTTPVTIEVRDQPPISDSTKTTVTPKESSATGTAPGVLWTTEPAYWGGLEQIGSRGWSQVTPLTNGPEKS